MSFFNLNINDQEDLIKRYYSGKAELDQKDYNYLFFIYEREKVNECGHDENQEQEQIRESRNTELW